MDPERGSVSSGAVVALYRTVAGPVVCQRGSAVPGKESAALRWWERCSGKNSGTVILCPVLSRSCAALVLTMTDSEAFVAFPGPCSRVCATAWQSSVFTWLRGKLVPLQGYQVRSGEIQRSSAEPGLSGTIRGLQVLPGSGDSCRPLPRSSAQLRCAAALGVPRCIGFYLRKRSCRHTAAYGSPSLSVCVAPLLRSGSTHRHSQGLQCFLSRSPVLSSSFQRNLRLS